MNPPTRAAITRVAEIEGRSVEEIQSDYLLMTMARSLADSYGSQLCFKGGFVLRHVHGQNRISGDLDATRREPARTPLDTNGVKRVVRESVQRPYRIDGVVRVVADGPHSLDIEVNRIAGPFVTDLVSIEISYREDARLQPVQTTIAGPFHEPFEVSVLDPREIIAEKVRTLVQRSRATDISDMHFLASRFEPAVGDPEMRELVGHKLAARASVFPHPGALLSRNVQEMEAAYTATIPDLAPEAPSYDTAVELILPLVLSWLP